MGYTFTDLTRDVADKSNLSNKEADKVLRAFFDTVTEQLNKGETVRLPKVWENRS